MIEIRIQRTLVFIIVETDLKAGIYIAYPRAVLVLFNIPFPTQVVRAIAAFLSQSHHITSDAGSQMSTQTDIFDGCIFAGNQRHLIFDISIRLHLSFQIHQKTAVLVQRLPGNSSLFMFCDFEVQIFPSTTVCRQFHRCGQDRTAIGTDTGHRFFKVTGDICR